MNFGNFELIKILNQKLNKFYNENSMKKKDAFTFKI